MRFSPMIVENGLKTERLKRSIIYGTINQHQRKRCSTMKIRDYFLEVSKMTLFFGLALFFLNKNPKNKMMGAVKGNKCFMPFSILNHSPMNRSLND
jgi:hypothetical protein